MLIYNYDNNGFFTGTSYAQKNPLKAGFLIPKNSTTVALPNTNIEAYQNFNFNGSSWLVLNEEEKVADLLKTTNQNGTLLYELVNGYPIARSVEDITAEEATLSEEDRLKALKNTMDEAILNKAKEISKGTTVESVQAFFQAFQIRAANASLYVNDGLIVRYVIAGYTLGEALDTEIKIVEYYNGLLVEMDKFREAEIAKYIVAIQNP